MARDKRLPFLKFYTSDWRGDPKLRTVSLAARGLCIELLCIMHEAKPRGSLLVGERKPSVEQVANLVGAPKKDVDRLMRELLEVDVLSRDADGTVFSRRMRRDDEQMRVDKENGSKGGNPQLKRQDNRGVNPPVDASDSPQSPEAKFQNTDSSRFAGVGSAGALPTHRPAASRWKTPLKETSKPLDEDVRYAIDEAGIAPEDVERQWRTFLSWALSGDVRVLDWGSAWRAWCDKEPEIQDKIDRIRRTGGRLSVVGGSSANPFSVPEEERF